MGGVKGEEKKLKRGKGGSRETGVWEENGWQRASKREGRSINTVVGKVERSRSREIEKTTTEEKKRESLEGPWGKRVKQGRPDQNLRNRE